jgi:AraC-type DNA-binding domain-containing proteins
MGHFYILELLISGGAGLAVLSIYYIYSFFNPSERLFIFLRLQVFVVFIIFLNIFHAYNLADLGASLRLQIASYCLSFIWAPGYVYFTGMFYISMAKSEASFSLRRMLLLLALAVGASSFIPLTLSGDLERILAYQRAIQRNLIIPCCGFTQVVFSVFFYIKAWSRSYRNHRIVSLCAIILNFAIAVACVLTINLSHGTSLKEMEPYLVVFDCYFLLWNLLALAILFKLAPLILKKRKEALKTGLAPESRSPDIIMDRDWRLVEGAVVGKKLYRKSGLDLATLSRETGMPRNRISLVVNTVTGKTFSDYVNFMRIAEFKKIASSLEFSGNILGAAFEAGFNSKATFYNWIKKDLSESPTEYLRRLRSDPSPLELRK